MTMKLGTQWRLVLRKSWSVRWIALAGLLSGAEVALPLFVDVIPRAWFSVLAVLAAGGAIWARVLVQPKDKL